MGTSKTNGPIVEAGPKTVNPKNQDGLRIMSLNALLFLLFEMSVVDSRAAWYESWSHSHPKKRNAAKNERKREREVAARLRFPPRTP